MTNLNLSIFRKMLPGLEQALSLSKFEDLPALMKIATELRDRGHGTTITYSKKVFIPLTKLCRDTCHYCTFAQPPSRENPPFLTPDEVLKIARAGAKANCREALFTLGDKPELRYRAAQKALVDLGYETTLDYLRAMADLVHKETGLLPHLNPGVMTGEDIKRLRTVSVSQGIMLETAAERLSFKGGPHYGSPDKFPSVRLETIEEAGKAAVPFTTGILIGIGETRLERIEALLLSENYRRNTAIFRKLLSRTLNPKPVHVWLTFRNRMQKTTFGP